MLLHCWLYHTVHRPYRIPVPDWAAILIVIPPTLGIGFIFATSNWYVYVFCAAALLLGFSLSKLSKVSKSRGWCSYKSKDNNYEKTPLDNDDITESMEGMTISPRSSGHHNGVEWEYSNEDSLFEIGEISWGKWLTEWISCTNWKDFFKSRSRGIFITHTFMTRRKWFMLFLPHNPWHHETFFIARNNLK